MKRQIVLYTKDVLRPPIPHATRRYPVVRIVIKLDACDPSGGLPFEALYFLEVEKLLETGITGSSVVYIRIFLRQLFVSTRLGPQ